VTVLKDKCHRFERILKESSRQCESMLVDLDQLERNMVIKPIEIVGNRLLVIAYWVQSLALERYEEHGGKGYVYVVIMENDKLVPYWFENKLTVADKKWWKANGYTIISIDETINTIKGLQHDMASGMWADVVEWIRRCGF